MVSVTVGNNVDKKTLLVESDSTLKSALTKGGVNAESGVFQLNGETISEGDLNKTFAQVASENSSVDLDKPLFLLNVKKVDNA